MTGDDVDATSTELSTAVPHGGPSPGPARPETQAVAIRSVRGAATLVGRQILGTGLTVVSGVVLARLLSPRDFGVYAVVYMVYGFLSALGDCGLGASLIQQSAEPTDVELDSVFTGQLGISVVMGAIGLIVAPAVSSGYHLGAVGEHIVQLTVAALLISSLQVIPGVQLERALRYDVIGLVGLLQSVVFNGVAIALAAAGDGAVSLGYALLAQAVLSSMVLLALLPRRPRLRWRAGLLQQHLRFGLPYQGMTLISLAKDSVSPLFVGALLGAAAVGLLEWAQRFAAFALLALLSLSRLYLASFSRVLDDATELRRMVAGAVWGCNALAAPAAVVIIVFARPITVLVFGVKWLPGLHVFYLLWAANVLAPAAGPLLGLLNALGRSRLALGFTVLWLILTWALAAPLIASFGLIGYGIANVCIQGTNVALYLSVRSLSSVRLGIRDFTPWLIGLAAVGAGCAFRAGLAVNTLPRLVIGALVTLAAYAALLLLFDRGRVLRVVRLAVSTA